MSSSLAVLSRAFPVAQKPALQCIMPADPGPAVTMPCPVRRAGLSLVTPPAGEVSRPPVLPSPILNATVAARHYETLRAQHGLLAMPPGAVDALLLRLPRGPDIASADAVRTTLHEYLCARFETFDVDLKPPSTAPTTNSNVYMVHAGGCVVAVFKLFSAPTDGYFQEITAIHHLAVARIKEVEPAPIWHLGSLLVAGVRRGFLLRRAAPGEDLEARFAHDLPETQDQALSQSGTAIAALHRHFRRSRDTTAIAQVRDYHVACVRRLLGPEGALAAFTRKGWLSDAQHAALTDAIEALAAAYAATDLDAMPIGVSHGDCYPANFVFAPPNALTLVDLQTLMWSLGPEAEAPHGIADVREDVGRFCEALVAQGLHAGIDDAITTGHINTFLTHYNATARLPVGVADAALAFFRLRFDAVVFSALANAWTQPRDGKRPFLKVSPATTRKLLLNVCARLGIR